MIEYYKKHTTHEPFHRIDKDGNDSWVHVTSPSEDELADVVERYELDGNIVRDVLDMHELTRSEYSKGSLYVFLRTATRLRSGEIQTAPFLAILTPDLFITLSSVDALQARDIAAYGKDKELRTADRATMLLLTVSSMLAQYEALIQHTGDYITDVRRKLKNHEVKNRDFVHFVTIEDNLNDYQMNLTGTLALLERFKDDAHHIFTPHKVEEVDDMRLYTKQLLSTVSRHMLTVTSIRNAYSTIANNTLNQRMKLLTALTVLIALPNVFYGMYGMNVPLPFQDEGWIYPIIVLFTILIILLVYSVARRFKVF